MSQTEGDEIPDTAPQHLQGVAPGGLFDVLAGEARAQGYEVCIEATCQPGANGQTDFVFRTITLAPGLSDAQRCKTMAHELCHGMLHHPEAADAPASRVVCEVESKSVAYLVWQAVGLDSEIYSLPYVGHWSAGDIELVAASAERVIAAAARIIEAVETAGAET